VEWSVSVIFIRIFTILCYLMCAKGTIGVILSPIRFVFEKQKFRKRVFAKQSVCSVSAPV